MPPVSANLTTRHRKQRTLRNSVAFSGIGIHTGKQVTMQFCPSKAGTGIVFKRTDLPGQPLVPATLEYVRDTSRSTTLGIGNVFIHTVEHVLAAVRAFEIDNLCIEVSNLEPPIGDGNSDTFVGMIEDAGIMELEATVPVVKLNKPIYWTGSDIYIVALPYDGYKISYTLNYPESKVLNAQFHSLVVTTDTFKNEIAPCRTFSRYEEVSALMDRGLIKGGSLDNAVIIKGNAVFSKEGLYFPNEMVRHKILDMIGDLSLVGFNFEAHIISLRSGHASNYEFAKQIYHTITTENS